MRESAKNVSARRWAIRGACLAVYLALLALLFVNGKGHVILLDNKAAGEASAFEYVLVGVDGKEPAEYYRGDRDKATVKGQKHRIQLELEDGTKLDKAIVLPLDQEMVLVSLPLMAADAEGAVVPLTPLDAAPPKDEPEGNVNEFTAPMGPEAPIEGAPLPAN